MRYADDSNVYVRSRHAGERVMALLRRLYGRLRLKVNETKSAVASVFGRKFPGYSLWVAPGGVVKRKVAAKPLLAFKRRIRELTSRSGGRSMKEVVERLRPYVLGWKAYFRMAQTPGVWPALEEWMRHRLRAIQLKHWRHGLTIYRELRALGASAETARQVAANNRCWWRNSDRALKRVLTIAYFDRLGGTSTLLTSTSRTARCGPACRVVWQGYGLLAVPYADPAFFLEREIQFATISKEWVNSAVFASMIDAEQYLSCERVIARSTVAGFRFLPVTVKWKWIFVNTFGSSLARSALSVTEQPATSWRLFFRIITTSYAVQPPVPSKTISIGRGERLPPPPSGAPSMVTRWPLPVSAANAIPSCPIQLTLHSMRKLRCYKTLV